MMCCGIQIRPQKAISYTSQSTNNWTLYWLQNHILVKCLTWLHSCQDYSNYNLKLSTKTPNIKEVNTGIKIPVFQVGSGIEKFSQYQLLEKIFSIHGITLEMDNT